MVVYGKSTAKIPLQTDNDNSYSRTRRRVVIAKPASCFFRYHRDTRGGGWSRYGCKSVKSNRTHTVCSCTHLTAFAVLSDLNLQVRLMIVKLLQQKATTTTTTTTLLPCLQKTYIYNYDGYQNS